MDFENSASVEVEEVLKEKKIGLTFGWISGWRRLILLLADWVNWCLDWLFWLGLGRLLLLGFFCYCFC